jgi:hypothetical protein
MEFAWLWLRTDESGERLSRAVELAGQHGALTDGILPPLVTCWFGRFPHFETPAGARSRFVAEVARQFGGDAKVLHGVIVARFGNVGSQTRFVYSAITPESEEILAALSELSFGECREFKKG